MNIVQFWIVDTIVKVTPTALKLQQSQDTIERNQLTSDNEQQDQNERSPLLPK